MAFKGIDQVLFDVGMYPIDCAVGPVVGPSKVAAAFEGHAQAAVVKG